MRHPLHPALVHFPIACWSLAVAADFASLHFGEMAWKWSAGLLTLGSGMALIAMLAGLVEFARVPEGAAMLAAFMLFSARLLFRLDHMQPLAPDSIALFLDALGFASLAIGGWLGGRLVYGHGVGRD
ncbi:MAG: DUF2231 domain-containing protein [Acinetobacter sp.]